MNATSEKLQRDIWNTRHQLDRADQTRNSDSLQNHISEQNWALIRLQTIEQILDQLVRQISGHDERIFR